jgi:hypothetical protein
MERKITEQTDIVQDTKQDMSPALDQPTLSERVWNEVLTEAQNSNANPVDFAASGPNVSTGGTGAGDSKYSFLPDIEMDADCDVERSESLPPSHLDDFDASVCKHRMLVPTKEVGLVIDRDEDNTLWETDQAVVSAIGPVLTQPNDSNNTTPGIGGSDRLPISAGGSSDLEVSARPLPEIAHNAPQAALDLHYAMLDVEQSIAALTAGIVADSCSFSDGQINLLRNAIMLKVGCERRHAHHLAAAAASGASTIKQSQAMSDARRTSERLDRIIAILSANTNTSAGMQPQ